MAASARDGWDYEAVFFSKLLSSLPPGSPCPLCQNQLGDDGSSRLRSFDEFLKGAAERNSAETREKAVQAYQSVKAADVDIRLDDGLRRELAAAYPTILAGCEALQQNLTARKSSVLVAAAGKLPWIEIQKEIDSPAPAIDDAISGLNIEAAAMEALVDERSRELLTSEFDDLEARAKLSSNRALAIEIVRRRDIANILGKCIDALSTTSISRKSTELSKTLATQEVADALNEELQALNCCFAFKTDPGFASKIDPPFGCLV